MGKIEKVTVLMAEYNTKKEQLKQSIESILNQTYKNFELIIIDDCSNEENIKLIESYKDDRIRLIRNEKNLGLAASLNKGIELATTNYIIRMDTDDIAKIDRIEKQVRFAENNPQYSIIGGRANFFDDKGIYYTTPKSGEIYKSDLIKGTPFIHPTMLINKEHIQKIGGYPLYRRCQDYAMAMNMYANGYKGCIMEDILIDYRMDTDGYKKKKFKYRVLETKIRFHYYRKLKIGLFQYIYCLKPILAGLMPKKLMQRYQKNKFKRNSNKEMECEQK